MDCKTARMMLDLAGPGSSELDPADTHLLESHLADCPDCRSAAQAERDFDARLGPVMRDVAVPPDLADRLLERLASERRTGRRRLIVPVALAATAACLFLGIWLFSGPERHLPAPNLELLAQISQRGSSPEQVEEWFKEAYNVRTVAPRQFDYGWLDSYDLKYFDGKRVPMLFFIHGSEHAKVYVFSAKQWNLKGIQAPVGYNIQLLSADDDSQVAFVAVYTGASLDWFLKKSDNQRAETQIRNPKLEIRNKFEIRNPKPLST